MRLSPLTRTTICVASATIQFVGLAAFDMIDVWTVSGTVVGSIIGYFIFDFGPKEEE